MQEAEHMRGMVARQMEIDEHKRLLPEVEREVNNRLEELLRTSGAPVEPSEHKDPIQYYVPADRNSGLPGVHCSCGWYKKHLRMKILQKAAFNHYLKTGHKPT